MELRVLNAHVIILVMVFILSIVPCYNSFEYEACPIESFTLNENSGRWLDDVKQVKQLLDFFPVPNSLQTQPSIIANDVDLPLTDHSAVINWGAENWFPEALGEQVSDVSQARMMTFAGGSTQVGGNEPSPYFYSLQINFGTNINALPRNIVGFPDLVASSIDPHLVLSINGQATILEWSGNVTVDLLGKNIFTRTSPALAYAGPRSPRTIKDLGIITEVIDVSRNVTLKRLPLKLMVFGGKNTQGTTTVSNNIPVKIETFFQNGASSLFLLSKIDSSQLIGASSVQSWIDTLDKDSTHRIGHSAFHVINELLNPPDTFLEGHFLIWGGFDADAPTIYYNSFDQFDSVTNRWVATPPTPAGQLPPARAYHTAVYILESVDAPNDIKVTRNSHMIIFGGTNGNTAFNDVWDYNIVTNTWMEITPLGTPPSPRYRHSAVIMSGFQEGTTEFLADSFKKILVFGGQTQDGTYLNDLWTLDLVGGDWTWSQLRNLQGAPSPRAGHVAIGIGLNYMIIHGGDDGTQVFGKMHFFDFECPHYCEATGSCLKCETDCIHRTTCDAARPFKCGFECRSETPFSAGGCLEGRSASECPSNLPILCPEGQCVDDEKLCTVWPRCPPNYIKCLDGSCHPVECPVDVATDCSNITCFTPGSSVAMCVTEEEECPQVRFHGCLPGQFQCEQGGCVFDLAECINCTTYLFEGKPLNDTCSPVIWDSILTTSWDSSDTTTGLVAAVVENNDPTLPLVIIESSANTTYKGYALEVPESFVRTHIMPHPVWADYEPPVPYFFGIWSPVVDIVFDAPVNLADTVRFFFYRRLAPDRRVERVPVNHYCVAIAELIEDRNETIHGNYTHEWNCLIDFESPRSDFPLTSTIQRQGLVQRSLVGGVVSNNRTDLNGIYALIFTLPRSFSPPFSPLVEIDKEPTAHIVIMATAGALFVILTVIVIIKAIKQNV